MRRLALTAAVLTAAGLPALSVAGEKRAATIADLYRVRGVAAPSMAPDGRAIVFERTTTDLSKVDRRTNLWRAEADGTGTRPLTVADALDTSPAFSPDGKALAFLSTRGGAAQVFFLPTAGGEPERKTDIPGGVAAFRVTPDGRRLVLKAEVGPSAGRTWPATGSGTRPWRRGR